MQLKRGRRPGFRLAAVDQMLDDLGPISAWHVMQRDPKVPEKRKCLRASTESLQILADSMALRPLIPLLVVQGQYTTALVLREG